METKNAMLLETENRGSPGRNKTFSVRFPSPCSEPSSPSSESRVKRNLAARSESTAKEIIMNWVKETLKDYPIPMTNFSSCWNDGLAFCALVHSCHPSSMDWHHLDKTNRRQLPTRLSKGRRIPGYLSFAGGGRYGEDDQT